MLILYFRHESKERRIALPANLLHVRNQGKSTLSITDREIFRPDVAAIAHLSSNRFQSP